MKFEQFCGQLRCFAYNTARNSTLSSILNMLNLTRQQQLVILAVAGMLLIGMAVKAWRTAHPPAVSEKSIR